MMASVWMLVSAGYAWRDIQNGDNVLISVVMSAFSLALVAVIFATILNMQSLKPGLFVTDRAVLLTSATFRRHSFSIQRMAQVRELTADTIVRVTKGGSPGELVINSAGASTSGQRPLKPLKISHIKNPDDVAQLISNIINEHAAVRESTPA